MLEGLAIRDIVLIDRLEVSFGAGLTALTGETGAGKSIILDALGLALGARGDRGLVRAGAEQGSVTAVFGLPQDHPARALFEEQGLDVDTALVLRRVLGADGRSRAFVNDQPVGTGLLRQVGDQLVEIHGQMEQQSLLAPATHRRLLDSFAALDRQLAELRAAHDRRRDAREHASELQARVEAAEREIDYLRHRERELADLAAQPGEERELAEKRARLQHRDKLVQAVSEALAATAGNGGAVERLAAAQRRLERAAGLDEALLGPALDAIARASAEVAEAEAVLERAVRSLDEDGEGLEQIEERLFALRAASRKHRVPADELPKLLEDTRAQLAEVDTAALTLEHARREVGDAEAAYAAAAAVVSAARMKAGGKLAKAVVAELPPLRLERTSLRVTLTPLAAQDQGPDGAERVEFEVSTNPGQPFGPIGKLASGGELSRLMLALKVVLARLDSTATLIFDEVDAGIGGATADAVGERLARLGAERQVLVVTHAPQVAARARQHLRVMKSVNRGRAVVQVEELSSSERGEEIARMLAGAAVTDAARAAARSLIEAAG
jgi:DNA repair protein RecN (Recombination protein N)